MVVWRWIQRQQQPRNPAYLKIRGKSLVFAISGQNSLIAEICRDVKITGLNTSAGPF